MSTVKGVAPPIEKYDGSSLRVLIVHARWNATVVDALVKGAIDTMTNEYSVKSENITIQSVSGSYELPFATQRLIAASRLQATPNAAELFSTTSTGEQTGPPPVNTQTFDVAICIGVLIKGSTMHFEYIADAASNGIMRVGLDSGVPCVFGVLTCLNEDQALERAGLGSSEKKHNHGIDWGHCAVELAVKNRGWMTDHVMFIY
ncbi:6,7-dimethyl-8-ribityllumazine synthase [Rhizophagus clarus]|uniref:6,7-dimethyl-8-ribityllumazine synthase n=1 Tax=Rhizophagus clarus TaxID=94130 RepID=A0A8H3KY54_9GLOM|nr:6,7-dimethyl-8-ribityllumazine synthase [Rhizophagus clarus]